MSVLNKFPFEIKQQILQYARPAYLYEVEKVQRKYSVFTICNFEIIYTNIETGNNNVETFNNIYDYLHDTISYNDSRRGIQYGDNICSQIGLERHNSSMENETFLLTQIETLFFELPLIKNNVIDGTRQLSRTIKNVHVINVNNILYTMIVVYNNGLNSYCDIIDYITEFINVYILHQILLKLDLYKYMCNLYYVDNDYVFNHIENNEELYIGNEEETKSFVYNYIERTTQQLDKLNQEQVLSIFDYYMKNY